MCVCALCECLCFIVKRTARYSRVRTDVSELFMGWVDPRVLLGWVGYRFYDFQWVGFGRGSEKFLKILQLVVYYVCNMYQMLN